MAHGDYILHQVRAALELGRLIAGEDFWNYTLDCRRHKMGTKKDGLQDVKVSVNHPDSVKTFKGCSPCYAFYMHNYIISGW